MLYVLYLSMSFVIQMRVTEDESDDIIEHAFVA